MAKKGTFAKHANRVGNRIAERGKNFVADARSGNYDHLRLSRDIANSITDVVDFWSGLFGGGASPSVGIADLGSAPPATWKVGVTITVLVNDPVPADARWPLGGVGNPPLLQLRPVAGGAAVSLDLQAVSIQDLLDDEGYLLRVTVRDPGVPPIAQGEYFANLYYESATAGPGRFFAALVKATVTP